MSFLEKHDKTTESDALIVILNQNIALVYNKLGDHKAAIRACTRALEIDEKAQKALFQRSVAFLKTQEYDKAAADCKAAIVENPKDKSFRD